MKHNNSLKAWEKMVFLGAFIAGILSLFMDAPEGPEPVMAIAWWIPMALGAAKGALTGSANQKKMKQHDKARKATIKYSPWTNMQDPGSLNLPGMGASMIGGAAQGAMMGQMAGIGGAADAAKTAAGAAPTAAETAKLAVPQAAQTAAPANQFIQSNEALQAANAAKQGSAGALGQGAWSNLVNQPMEQYGQGPLLNAYQTPRSFAPKQQYFGGYNELGGF